MKKPLMLVLAVFIAMQLNAQKTNVTFGETIRMTLKNYFFNMEIIGSDETGVYGIQMPANEVYSGTVLGGIKNYQLARYNAANLSNPELFELDLKDKDADRDYEYTAQIGKEIYVFSSFQNRKLKKTFLFAQTVNRKKLGLNSDLKKIAEVDWHGESKYDRANFGFKFSRDKSKLMVRYNLVNKDNEVLRFGICSMDAGLQVLWQTDGLIPVKDGAIFNFKKFYIDNKGDVYLLGILFKSEKEMERTNNMRKKSLLSSKRTVQREPNYVYQVITYSNKGKTLTDYVIEEPGKFISDMQIGVNDKQDIVLTGLYADEAFVSVKGAFSMKIAKGAKAPSNKVFHAFDNNYILKGLDEKAQKKILDNMSEGEEFDKYQYAMEDIQFHDNGNYSLVAEQYVEESKTVRSMNTVSTEYQYYDDNVLVITFKPDGSVLWKDKVLKQQFTHSVNRAYASFALITAKNRMYFVFNEFPEGKPRKSTAVMVEVGPDGTQRRERLFSSEEKKLVQPLTYRRTAEKEMCMFGLEGRNYSLARLAFN